MAIKCKKCEEERIAENEAGLISTHHYPPALSAPVCTSLGYTAEGCEKQGGPGFREHPREGTPANRVLGESRMCPNVL